MFFSTRRVLHTFEIAHIVERFLPLLSMQFRVQVHWVFRVYRAGEHVRDSAGRTVANGEIERHRRDNLSIHLMTWTCSSEHIYLEENDKKSWIMDLLLATWVKSGYKRHTIT